MSHILVVNGNELVNRAAAQLKEHKLVSAPEWSVFVKTGAHKERLPEDADWWYMRSAAILRKVAQLGPVGTSKLRVKFGGRKNRGHKPGRFVAGSGSIIRKSLQQLESSGLIAQTAKGVHKGRVLTPKGVSFLDKIAMQMLKESRTEKK
ncbi:30S ribosomal protein S19e [archaeon]|nr:30S ribosomal protein S19e [archaeon]